MPPQLTKPKQASALVLFSGGLDSLLVVKILTKLGFNVTALAFSSPFVSTEKILNIAKRNKIKLRLEDFSKTHLSIVKNPRFGYGKHLNPCLDCHLGMIKKAAEIQTTEQFDLLATGEVLGQRPKSQNKTALKLIDEKSGLAGKILRPLSAKLLEETEYEKNNLIDRSKLFAISGRYRHKQLQLAHVFHLKEFDSPSGGCLLTDKNFSKKMKTLLEKKSDCSAKDIGLLKFGRVFWIGKNLIVIGRHKEDNQELTRLYQKDQDFFMKLKDYQGPIGIIRNFGPPILEEQALKKIAGQLGWYYTKARPEKTVNIILKTPTGTKEILDAPINKNFLKN